MQAVILAGGLGTRLGDLTESLPKPMVDVHGKPFLEYELALLREHGVTDVVLCLGHLAEGIMGPWGGGRGPLGGGCPLRPAHRLGCGDRLPAGHTCSLPLRGAPGRSGYRPRSG